MRRVLCQPPLPWTRAYIAELARHPVWAHAEPDQPQWASAIVKHRDFFSECAILVVGEDDDAFYKIVYMVQNPVYLALSPMSAIALPTPNPAHDLMDRIERSVCGRWACHYGSMMTAGDLMDVTPDQIWIVPCIVHEGGVMASSTMQPVPYRTLLVGEEIKSTVSEGPRVKKAKVDSKHWDDCLLEFPWLAPLDDKQVFVSSDADATARGSRDVVGIDDAEQMATDEAVLEAMAALDKARAAVADAGEHSDVDFVSRVRVSRARMEAEGAGPDAIQGQCRSNLAEDWARTRGLQVTFKCTFTVHGLDGVVAGILCRAWCHRMQFFFEKSLAKGDDAADFSEADVAAYAEPTELARLASDGCPKKVMERVVAIRKIPQ